jgi:hypothetical protein
MEEEIYKGIYKLCGDFYKRALKMTPMKPKLIFHNIQVILEEFMDPLNVVNGYTKWIWIAPIYVDFATSLVSRKAYEEYMHYLLSEFFAWVYEEPLPMYLHFTKPTCGLDFVEKLTDTISLARVKLVKLTGMAKGDAEVENIIDEDEGGDGCISGGGVRGVDSCSSESEDELGALKSAKTTKYQVKGRTIFGCDFT